MRIILYVQQLLLPTVIKRDSSNKHARRVLRILNLDDQIDGVVYCNYDEPDFPCKPEPEFYHLVSDLKLLIHFFSIRYQALRQANLSDPSKCFFVDDNRKNVDVAKKLGWGSCVHFCEAGLEVVEGGKLKQIADEREQGAVEDDIPVINDLEELRVVWRQIFKT